MLMCLNIDINSEAYILFEDFFKSLNDYVGIFFKINENKMLNEFHKELMYKRIVKNLGMF
jgi:hypothetical protein